MYDGYAKHADNYSSVGNRVSIIPTDDSGSNLLFNMFCIELLESH